MKDPVAGDELRDGLRRLGYDPGLVLGGPTGAVPKVYAENARADAAALRDLLAREALGFGLACSETAFLAVRTEAGQVVEGRVAVANALPAGWSEDFLQAGVVMTCAPLSLGSRALGGMVMSADPMTAPPPDAALRNMSLPRQEQLPDLLPAPPPDAALHNMSPRMAQSSPSPGKLMKHLSRMFGGTPPPSEPEVSGPGPTVVFRGSPVPAGGEAILFDTARAEDADVLPDLATFGRLVVRFPGGMPDPRTLDPGLALLIFVEDLTLPRARVRLVDLVRQRGERPLNLRKAPGQAVRVVLIDPAGAWARGAPEIELALGW